MIKVIEDIKTLEELQEFAEAQYYTIINQSKKIHKLEEANETLEIKSSSIASVTNIVEGTNSDAETICVTQLRLIKLNSETRELTLEETKKVETFTKTLLLIKGKNTEEKFNNKETTRKMTTEELLKMATDAIEQ